MPATNLARKHRSEPMIKPSRKKRYLQIIAGIGIVLGVIAISLVYLRGDSWAESVKCGNQITSICLGARIWASEHEEVLPSSFFTISNELASPRVLICPARYSADMIRPWEPDANYYDYEIVTTNLSAADHDTPFIRCRVHGHTGYSDGTVFDGSHRRTKWP
jgi:hypothetical protein